MILFFRLVCCKVGWASALGNRRERSNFLLSCRCSLGQIKLFWLKYADLPYLVSDKAKSYKILHVCSSQYLLGEGWVKYAHLMPKPYKISQILSPSIFLLILLPISDLIFKKRCFNLIYAEISGSCEFPHLWCDIDTSM